MNNEVAEQNITENSNAVNLTPIELERFWQKVDKSAQCWMWTASQNGRGYGRLHFKGSHHGAHRVSWIIHNGSIGKNMCVLHRCDVRNCVNPDHLFLGTNDDNVMDKVRKGRCASVTGDRNGARLHPERLARGERNGAHTKPESVLRGERSGMAKLSNEKVLDIRSKYATGGITYKKLADFYSVTPGLIGFVIRRVIWSHV